MRKLFTLAAGLLATAAHAQSIASLSPAANALAVLRTAPVVVTLAAPASPGTTLKVFSSLVGGQKAGTLTLAGNTVRFAPTTGFLAGETLTAVFTSATASRVWQFTAAATGTGYFGGGSDLSVAAYPYGSTLLGIAAGDLTGDGSVDIIGEEIGTNPSQFFINNGTGQLRNSYASIGIGASYTWFMLPPIGDLNGDGLLDLGRGINQGNAAFSYPTLVTTIYPSEYGGVLTDVDADGDLDYAFTSGRQLYVYTNTGNGMLAAPGPGTAVDANGFLSAGDFDGDGDTDLVLYSMNGSGSLALLRNNGQGLFAVAATYSARVSTPFYQNHTVAVGDLDGDSDLDLVVPLQLHLLNSGTSTPSVDIWLNDGQGNFTAPSFMNAPTSGISGSSSVALGDLDGDGDLDLLSAQVYRNNGAGLFTSIPSYTTTGPNSNGGIALADMNNDGSLDIVAAKFGSTPGGPGSGTPGVLSVRLNGYALATQPARAADVQVWPNPVAGGGQLHIGKVPAGTTATLHNLLGQRVTSAPLSGSPGELSTAGLVPGLYVLSLQVANHLPLTYRVAVE